MKRKFFDVFTARAAVMAAVITGIVFAGCTFPLDPVNALDPNSLADPNTGTIQVFNDSATSGRNVPLSAVRITQPNGSFSEFPFGGGLGTGKYSEKYRFSSGKSYQVKFHDGRGWTVTAKTVFVEKGENAVVSFDGTDEVSIDLSGAKGKLTVFNRIPPKAADKEYVIEDLRVSLQEGDLESETYYFYLSEAIAYGKSYDVNLLPGTYWVRARIRNPTTGKLSKWSIPACVGQPDNSVSAEPGGIEISASKAGVAVFNEKVLLTSGEVDIGSPSNPGSTWPEAPDNGLIDSDGNEKSNVDGTVDGNAKPVLATKAEKLGFPDYTHDGVTINPIYAYSQKTDALKAAKIVKTTIYNTAISSGGAWKLSLSEAGWYLISFSEDGLSFSKSFPIRLSKDAAGNWVVEPSVIPPYNGDDPIWTDKMGVVISNDTPVEGGPVIDTDGNPAGKTITSLEAQRPITDIKVYNTDGTLYGYYHNVTGMPITNNREWIITPALPLGDYLITLSDDYGKTWTDPFFPFRVDSSGNGNVSYDKTHPWWTGKAAGKPLPGRSKSGDPWDNTTKGEIGDEAVIVTVPEDSPLNSIPAGPGPYELDNETKGPAKGSQLEVVNKSGQTYVINYLKLNLAYSSRQVYRIIDLTSQGGISSGERLSLVGFDLKPDLYWVYVSQDGKVWQRYKPWVAITTPWVYTAGQIKYSTSVPKVIYNDGNWIAKPSYEDPDVGGGAVPGPVTGLAAVPGNGSATLNWTNPATTTSAQINYARNDAPGVILGETTIAQGGATGTYTVLGLTAGIQYLFTVKAGNVSGLSTPVSVMATPTGSGGSGNWDISGITATPASGKITLSWTNPSSSLFKGVKITYRKGLYLDKMYWLDTSETVVGVVTGAHSREVTGLTNGDTYYFTLTAVDTGDNLNGPHTLSAAPSATPSDTTPPGSINPFTATAGNSKITLNWTNPGDTDLKDILIAVKLSNGDPVPAYPSFVVVPKGSSPQSYEITELINGTNYKFLAWTRDTSGNISTGYSECTGRPGTGASDPNAVYVRADGSDAAVGTREAPVKTVVKALTLIAGTKDTIVILGTVELNTCLTVTKTVTLKGEDGVLKPISSGYNDTALLQMVSAQTLTLDSGLTLDWSGLLDWSGTDDAGVVQIIHGGAVFEMKGGAIKGSLTGYAHGVSIESGRFDMSGGTISGYRSTYGGAGVYASSSTFNMSGGTISGNQAPIGGGVFLTGGAVLNMSGSAEISNNTATYGGAGQGGGGVYLASSNVTLSMSGGTISNNKASYGGGVYLYQGLLTMTGTGSADSAKISNNTAEENGGGVFVGSATFNMSGGIISGNKAQQGGGVAMTELGTFTMSNAPSCNSYISNNTVSLSGGGVYVRLGTFTMDDGEIGGNVVNRLSTTPDKGTRARGAGVFVSKLMGGRFVQGGGSIFGKGDGAAKANVVKINGVDVLDLPSPSNRGHGSLVCIHIAGTDPNIQTTWLYTQKETDGGMTLDTNDAEGFVNHPWEWHVPGYNL
jgi:hypothetical protein